MINNIITVTFPTSSKRYDYLVSVHVYERVIEGESYWIVNSEGYNYQGALVKVVEKRTTYHLNSRARYKTIVALLSESTVDSYGDSCGLIMDLDISENNFYTAQNSFSGCKVWTDKEVEILFANNYEIACDKYLERYTMEYNSDSVWVNDYKQTGINITNKYNKVGEDNMNTKKIFGNLEFGPIGKYRVAVTLQGLAVYSGNCDDRYITYDITTDEVVDVTELKLDIDVSKFVYKIPCALPEIKESDLIIHNNLLCTVKSISGNVLTVFEYNSKSLINVIAPKSVFGFNFITKVVNLFGDMNFNATKDQPFGNILPFLMLSENKFDMSDIMIPLMMMNGGVDFSNPMMMYALMGKGDNDIMLPLLMMNGGFNFNLGAGAKAGSEE